MIGWQFLAMLKQSWNSSLPFPVIIKSGGPEVHRWAQILVSSLILSSSALAEQSSIATPFDFVWGETIEDVTSRYGLLEATDSSPYRTDLESFLLSDFPEGAFLPDTASVRVEFSQDGGLEALKLRTATFDDDDEGTEARRLFSLLREELITTWVEGDVFEVGPREPWAAADQFYQCALDGMCGFLKAYYPPSDCNGTYVVLEFVPEQRRVGHFTVSYIDAGVTDACPE